MSDLISRSKVIAVLEKLEEHSLTGKMDISNAIYLLENQPTAYDVDKVVEQLEEVKNKDTEIALDEAQKERCFWYAQGMNRAIEIVKGGVVDAGSI